MVQLLTQGMCDPKTHTCYTLFYWPAHPHIRLSILQGPGFSRKQTDPGPVLQELSPGRAAMMLQAAGKVRPQHGDH